MEKVPSVSNQIAEEQASGNTGENSLIQQAKHDSSALSLLYRQHYSAIAGYIYRRVADRHEADDIISDVFLAMVKNLPRYQCRGVPFRIWLFRLATSQLSRWARRRRRWASQELWVVADEVTTSDSKNTSDTEMVDLVLSTLPPRLQTVLSLHYLEGIKIVDIAKVVKCSVGTVKSRLSEGRSLMRKRLEMRGCRYEN